MNVRKIKITCPSCGQHVQSPADVIGTVIACPSCNTDLHVGKRNIKNTASKNLVATGYILCALALLPIMCISSGVAVAGLVVGILNVTKGNTIHGIVQIVLSIFCGYLGFCITCMVIK